MRKRKIEKWLSDRIDGELSEKKAKILEELVEKDAAYHSYARDLERIQVESLRLKSTGVSPAYREEFVSRLRKKISSFSLEEKRRPPIPLRWKWAAGASLIFVIALGLFLFLSQPKAVQEDCVFSFEDSMARIDQEISENPELEELFNSVILASLGDMIGYSDGFVGFGLSEGPLPWESLGDEEIKILESELKKNNKL